MLPVADARTGVDLLAGDPGVGVAVLRAGARLAAAAVAWGCARRAHARRGGDRPVAASSCQPGGLHPAVQVRHARRRRRDVAQPARRATWSSSASPSRRRWPGTTCPAACASPTPPAGWSRTRRYMDWVDALKRLKHTNPHVDAGATRRRPASRPAAAVRAPADRGRPELAGAVDRARAPALGPVGPGADQRREPTASCSRSPGRPTTTAARAASPTARVLYRKVSLTGAPDQPPPLHDHRRPLGSYIAAPCRSARSRRPAAALV